MKRTHEIEMRDDNIQAMYSFDKKVNMCGWVVVMTVEWQL